MRTTEQGRAERVREPRTNAASKRAALQAFRDINRDLREGDSIPSGCIRVAHSVHNGRTFVATDESDLMATLRDIMRGTPDPFDPFD